MSSSLSSEAPRAARDRLLPRLGLGLALVFLAGNLAVRVDSLAAIAPRTAWLSAVSLVLAAAALVVKPLLAAHALELFGASFLLFGFHAYRPQSQIFELLVSALAAVLCLRLARGATPASAAGARTLAVFSPYGALASCSLLLLPRAVLEHRSFLEGDGIGRAVLAAFPKDPLYGLASIDRLWLFVAFAALLAAQPDAARLYRRLWRGVAWSAVLAAILGLLDFAGVVSLARYNLSHLFYGPHYRRLQSTFGNPSWFACFVACAFPFVLLAFHEARGKARLALAAAFPLCAASLVLSAARAAWLATLVLLTALAVAAQLARRRGRALPPVDGTSWLALGSTVATVALLAATALMTPADNLPDTGRPAGRLEGLSRELQYRGLGVASPRRVAAAYALELAKLSPVVGLGHDSFNMHLRAQLQIQASGVSRVMNAALLSDPSETVFDDSHNTYLQVLAGTGALGLGLWLLVVVAGLRAALRAWTADVAPAALAVLLGLVVFGFYGLFQGMAYIPMTFFLFPALTGHAFVLDPGPRPGPQRVWRRLALLVLGAALLAAAGAYAHDSGYPGLKRRFGVAAYLPDEAAEFEGFYRPESGPAGEFRWMARRGIVNLASARPFTLRFACEHPDAEREPVVLSLRFDDRDAVQIVFRRPGAVERRFAFGSPGSLRLGVSRTFRPAADDRRELGVAVSAIRWE
jgi:O-antigen ligase